MSICSESHTFDWRPDYPLVVSAKRYWDPLSTREDGFTCILAHGTGFHGEQWEPTLRHLFSLSKNSRAFPIRDVWSVDCPNHGDAAVINEEVLLRGGYELVFSWTEYAYALYLFLTQNKNVQFSDRKIIAIGHSMGATCLSLTQTYPHPPTFAQLILCEPMMAPTDIPQDYLHKVGQFLITSTEARRDKWPSSEDAYNMLKSRKAFAAWDNEVLKIFVEYGLRRLPTMAYPDEQGVTLKCLKVQEAATYRDSVTSRRAYNFLPTLCFRLPVHLIWGAIDDILAPELKNRVTDVQSGHIFASISRVEGAGHLVVQMKPRKLAEVIFSAIIQTTGPQGKL